METHQLRLPVALEFERWRKREQLKREAQPAAQPQAPAVLTPPRQAGEPRALSAFFE